MIFKAMLDLLRDNKRFPYYAAERRIDLFINIFLEQILTAYYNEKVNFVVPEFPLKLESNNQADKLDYLCAFDNTKQPIFVELKTDTISYRRTQASFYIEQSESWPACVEGLKAIICNRRMRFSYREKYFQSIKRLISTGLADLADELAVESVRRLDILVTNLVTPKDKGEFSRDLIKLSRKVHARWNGESKLLYLIPNSEKLKNQIQLSLGNKVNILDFTQIGNLPISTDMSYATEFSQLAEFLRDLNSNRTLV